ncbi:MAG: hypothetical protein ACTJIB_10610 [Pseudoalteromonas prydzensis]|uniref:hypothetical protein n=1 Tax=Pseudoalteromonas prydzensis TaxID=182141 RepID=UPI003F98F119
MSDGKHSNTKLGQALQNAALENINDDLKDIFDTLEKISKSLPELARKEVEALRSEISGLESALKVVPDEFNYSFGNKINRILDVASEIEDHTKKYQQTLVLDLQNLLSNYVDSINKKLSNEIKSNFIIKDNMFYLAIFLSSVFGGCVSACLIFFLLKNFY